MRASMPGCTLFAGGNSASTRTAWENVAPPSVEREYSSAAGPAGPSFTDRHLIVWPLTMSVSSSAAPADFWLTTSPLNRPWVESYLSK